MLLITDGLDRDEDGDLAFEIDRLPVLFTSSLAQPAVAFRRVRAAQRRRAGHAAACRCLSTAHSLDSIGQLSALMDRDPACDRRVETLASWQHRLHDILNEQTAGGTR